MKTILIIEDDHETRVAFRSAFEGQGFVVLTSANGRQALEMLKNLVPPDLLIVDLMMPMMSGIEFIKSVARMPGLEDVPILIVSASDEVVQTPPNLTCYRLRKPVVPSELIKAANKCIDQGTGRA